MDIYIKNMVCDRCIMAVRSIFENLGIVPVKIELGQVDIKEDVVKEKMNELQTALQALGFEIIDDKKSRIIEKIKAAIIQFVHHANIDKSVNLSDSIVKSLHYDYGYLSTLFSEVEGTTIEKYFIRQKIEKAKELLVYDEHSISQIADMLGYSSVAHLSNQFKQITGFTPSYFKNLREKRKPIDKV